MMWFCGNKYFRCGVCSVCRVVAHYTARSTHTTAEILVATTPQIIKRCIFTDQLNIIVALARLSIRSLKLVQLDRNM
jgi:hypothetical protein